MNRREFVGRAAGALGALSIANPGLAETSSSDPIISIDLGATRWKCDILYSK